jgi:hypothetical protein
LNEISKALTQYNRPLKAYEFHLSYLSLVDGSDKDSGVQAKKALLKALSLESVFNFESLLSLKPVAALKGKEVAYELATVFLGGSVTAYKDFLKKNSSFCQSNGISPSMFVASQR